jgi:hypothetical protein
MLLCQTGESFAFADPYNWNDILAITYELRPDQTFWTTSATYPRDLSSVGNDLGEELLKWLWNHDGYTSLKESVKQNLEGY